MAERVGRKGIVEISSYKTTDGNLHATMAEAERHQETVNINARLASLLKMGVEALEWSRDSDVDGGTFTVKIKGGSVINVFGGGGDETTYTELCVNGKTLEA